MALYDFSRAVADTLKALDLSSLSHEENEETKKVCVNNIGVFLQVSEVLERSSAYDKLFIELRKEFNPLLERLELYNSPKDLHLHQPSPPEGELTLSQLYEQAFAAEKEFQSYISHLKRMLDKEVKMGPIKSKHRSMEKIETEYNGDTSRLVDILRASAIFPDICELCDAFTKIRADETVRVVKVKNGFYGDSMPGGYRDLKLLLALKESGHIFELQLHLQSFFQIKSQGGHTAYMWARRQKIANDASALQLIPANHQTFDILKKMLEIVERNTAAVEGLGWMKVELMSHLRLEDGQVVQLHREEVERNLQSLGEESPDTLVSIHNLACSLDDQGKYVEAEDLYRKSLTISLKVLGENHPDTLTSYSNIARNLTHQERFEEAENYQRKSVSLSQTVLGREHPSTLISYNNLANILDKQEKHSEAEELLRKSLSLHAKVLGEEHPSTLAAYNNLAAMLNHQERFEEAEKLYRASLSLHLKVFGQEHAETLTSLNNLASALCNQEKLMEAEIMQRRCIALSRKLFGEDHPYTASSYANLAFALEAQGERRIKHKRQRIKKRAEEQGRETFGEEEEDEIVQLRRKALQIRRKVVGTEHPLTIESLNDLAVALSADFEAEENEEEEAEAEEAREERRRKKAKEIERLYEECLNLRESALGKEHGDTIASYLSLAGALDLQERFEESETLYHTAAKKRKELLGEEHPDTVIALNCLGLNFSRQGKHRFAVETFQETLPRLLKIFSEKHADTLNCYNNLANSLAETERYLEAIEVCKKSLELRCKYLGPTHIDTLHTLDNLALLHIKHYSASLETGQQLETGRRSLSSSASPRMPPLVSLPSPDKTQGEESREKTNLQQVEALLKESLALYTQVLGKDHHHTVSSLYRRMMTRLEYLYPLSHASSSPFSTSEEGLDECLSLLQEYGVPLDERHFSIPCDGCIQSSPPSDSSPERKQTIAEGGSHLTQGKDTTKTLLHPKLSSKTMTAEEEGVSDLWSSHSIRGLRYRCTKCFLHSFDYCESCYRAKARVPSRRDHDPILHTEFDCLWPPARWILVKKLQVLSSSPSSSSVVPLNLSLPSALERKENPIEAKAADNDVSSGSQAAGEHSKEAEGKGKDWATFSEHVLQFEEYCAREGIGEREDMKALRQGFRQRIPRGSPAKALQMLSLSASSSSDALS